MMGAVVAGGKMQTHALYRPGIKRGHGQPLDTHEGSWCAILPSQGLSPFSYSFGMTFFGGYQRQRLKQIFSLAKPEFELQGVAGGDPFFHQLHGCGHGASCRNRIQSHLGADHVGHSDRGHVPNTTVQAKGPNSPVGRCHPFSFEEGMIYIRLLDTGDGAGKTPSAS